MNRMLLLIHRLFCGSQAEGGSLIFSVEMEHSGAIFDSCKQAGLQCQKHLYISWFMYPINWHKTCITWFSRLPFHSWHLSHNPLRKLHRTYTMFYLMAFYSFTPLIKTEHSLETLGGCWHTVSNVHSLHSFLYHLFSFSYIYFAQILKTNFPAVFSAQPFLWCSAC